MGVGRAGCRVLQGAAPETAVIERVRWSMLAAEKAVALEE